MTEPKDTPKALGCEQCKDLTGRFHCAACGFDGGRTVVATDVVSEPSEAPLVALGRIRGLVERHFEGRDRLISAEVLAAIAKELGLLQRTLTVSEVNARLAVIQMGVKSADWESARLEQVKLYERLLEEVAGINGGAFAPAHWVELARLALTSKNIVTRW